jgi:transcriptional regulator NrdR family protein
MNCPKCGSDQCFVADVRPQTGYIKRRRECMFCGERFNTAEIKEEEYKIYEEMKLKLLGLVSNNG